MSRTGSWFLLGLGPHPGNVLIIMFSTKSPRHCRQGQGAPSPWAFPSRTLQPPASVCLVAFCPYPALGLMPPSWDLFPMSPQNLPVLVLQPSGEHLHAFLKGEGRVSSPKLSTAGGCLTLPCLGTFKAPRRNFPLSGRQSFHLWEFQFPPAACYCGGST